MKPKIWRVKAFWFCSYYPQSDCLARGRGKTPFIAWHNWKYRTRS